MTNTNLPPIPAQNANNYQAVINQYNAEIRRQLRTVDRSVRDLRSTVLTLANSFTNFHQVSKNLIDVFKKADSLQIKSLSINTTLMKNIQENSKQLDKLQGGFYENVEELIDNLAYGLDNNSDSLLTLQNKMRLSGQSTESLREAMGIMESAFLDGLDSTEGVIKSNQVLANTYKTSSQDLLDAIQALQGEISEASFYGAGEEVAKLGQYLQAIGKGAEGKLLLREFQSVLNQSITQGSVTGGLGFAQKIKGKSLEESLDVLQSVLQERGKFARQLAPEGTAPEIGRQILGPEFKEFMGAIRASEIIKSKRKDLNYDVQTNVMDSIKAQNEKLNSTYAEVTKSFYEPIVKGVNIIGPALLVTNTLMGVMQTRSALLAAQTAANLAGQVGGGAARLGILTPILARVAPALVTALPWVAAFAAVAGVGYGIYRLFSNDKEKESLEIQKKQLAELEFANKDKKAKEQAEQDKYRSMDMFIGSIIRVKDNEDSSKKALEESVKYLKAIYGKMDEGGFVR